MLDRPKRKRRKNLTAMDVPHIKALIEQNPESTCASIARLIGRDRGNFGRFVKKHGLVFPREQIKHPLRARGLVGEILRLAEAMKISQRSMAAELQVDKATIMRWRLGHSEPTLFLAECMAEMAGYKLALIPLSDLSSQDDRQ